jgi:hypothetical protein
MKEMTHSIIDKIKEEARVRRPGILKEEDTERFKNLVGKIVINLSDIPITEAQEKVLEKGYHSAQVQEDQISQETRT